MKHETIQIFTFGLMLGGIAVFMNGWALLAVLVMIALVALLTVADIAFNYEIIKKKVKR